MQPARQDAYARLTLICKPSADGQGPGDCPFTHYARMVLCAKGVDCAVLPMSKASKPAWLVDLGGSLPCLTSDLATGADAVVDSAAIAAHVNRTYGLESGCVAPMVVGSDEASSACAGLFGALAKFIKHADDDGAANELLKEAVCEELRKIERFLEARAGAGAGAGSGGHWLCDGDALGLLDCSVAPKLWVLQVAGGHYKNFLWPQPRVFPRLAAYQERVFATDAFKSTMCSPDEVIFGWGQGRAGGH